MNKLTEDPEINLHNHRLPVALVIQWRINGGCLDAGPV